MSGGIDLKFVIGTRLLTVEKLVHLERIVTIINVVVSKDVNFLDEKSSEEVNSPPAVNTIDRTRCW